MPTLTYPHWRDVPANAWRWPNFSAAEIACRGTGAIKINTEAMDKLQALRDRLGKPLAARAVGFLGFGTYPRSGFMHIDLGPARSWGDPFPVRPVPFAPELPPAREVLSESRTLRGGGAAGAATVGAAGVEVLQEVLAETQSTIQPLVPYLDTLRWVLIGIALIGIAVTIHARLDDWKRGQR